MSARSEAPWHLLGSDGDPLPGDAYDVSLESTHYAETAQAIHDQVARLRKIAAGSNELVGKYAPALQDSAKDLADHLDDTEGRFDTVAAQLKIWQPVLSDGMVKTYQLVCDAEAAQQTIDSHQPPDTPVDPKDDKAVAADKTRNTKLQNAQGDLNALVSQFNNLMDGVNHTADSVAKKISDAANDNLKDSWWDKHVRKWIHDHAELLKFIADVLTWIATAIVIVILVVGTGGMALAALLTVGALLIHTMLAANGDGSWTDVAIDAFALVTMGAGKMLTTGAKGFLAAREGASTFAETSSAARAAFGNASGFFGKAGAWLSKSNIVARNLRGAAAFQGKFAEIMATEFKGGRLLDVLTMGDKASAGLYQAINASISKFGPGFLLNSAHGMMNVARVTFLGGMTVDLGAKTLNPAFPNIFGDGEPIKPAISGWGKWADDHTVPHGGYW